MIFSGGFFKKKVTLVRQVIAPHMNEPGSFRSGEVAQFECNGFRNGSEHINKERK